MIYNLTDQLILYSKLPSNLAIKAAVSTFLLLLLLLAAGWLIRFISDMITGIFAFIGGEKAAFFIRNYLTYAGTIHHELSHALLILLTGGKVKKITLIPKGRKLGSVEFSCRGNFFFRGLQLSLPALAPVLCGAVSLLLMHQYLLPYCLQNWQLALYYYFFISIFFHMTLSRQDMENFWHGILSLLLLLFLLNLLILYFGLI